MVAAIVIAVVAACCLLGYMVWVGSKYEQEREHVPVEPPPSEAERMQARLDLLKVELGFSAALAKLEHQQAAEQVKDDIAEAFEDRQ